MKFDKKVLIIGYGAVGKCTLPILLKEISIPYQNITIIDFIDKKEELTPWTSMGINYIQEKITPTNLTNFLGKYAGKNGLIIDVARNIETTHIIEWCSNNECLYINTSVELWDPYTQTNIFEKTLYYRQMELKALKNKLPKTAPTAIVDHGANPGLISHFVKKGLLDIANAYLNDVDVSLSIKEEIKKYMSNKNFPSLAHTLDIKVIHCSERDTQITNIPKKVNEFVNTWSIEGIREEGIAPAEMGWGTHEKELPPLAHSAPFGPKNQIFLAKMGINTKVKSYIPEIGDIEGMIIRHGEAFGISDRLTLWDGEKAIYRPTVHYAYVPCHECIASLDELRSRNYELQPKVRIMSDDITQGKDILGALLMGHKYNAWWTGSILSIEETRKIISGQSATTLQVAGGLLGAIKWMILNPHHGICIPDDIPHDAILDVAMPYLGTLHSQAYDWTPLKNKTVFFPENKDNCADETDPWQFKNFLPLP